MQCSTHRQGPGHSQAEPAGGADTVHSPCQQQRPTSSRPPLASLCCPPPTPFSPLQPAAAKGCCWPLGRGALRLQAGRGRAGVQQGLPSPGAQGRAGGALSVALTHHRPAPSPAHQGQGQRLQQVAGSSFQRGGAGQGRAAPASRPAGQPPPTHQGRHLHHPWHVRNTQPISSEVTQAPPPPARTGTNTNILPQGNLCYPPAISVFQLASAFTTHMPMQTKLIPCPKQIQNPAPRTIAPAPHSSAYDHATLTLPSCSLPSTPQPKPSLYPPTKDP
jgi:hypothetical protein